MDGLKITRKIPLCILAIFIAAAGTVTAQDVSVEAQLDTNHLLIGDQVALHFTFTGPAGAQILWPRLPDTIYNSLQVIDRGKPDTSYSQDKKTATIRQKLLLTSFDTGFYTLPPIPFYYRLLPDTTTQVAETGMLLIDVQTVPVDTTKAIKPIKGPVKVPWTFREFLPWIIGILAAGAITALVVYFLKRRKKKQPLFQLIPKTQLKPHEIALAALEELRVKKIWQSGRTKEFHSELTDILRKYIEERYGIMALESTSDEILEALGSSGAVDQTDLSRLRRILLLADLVKFAKAIPLGGENEEHINLGIQFVNSTVPKVAQPVAEPEK